MGSLTVVVVQIGFQIRLHLLQELIPGLATLDAEVLIQQGAVQAFDIAIALGPTNFSGAMLDPLELQKQFVRVFVGTATEFPTVVR